MLSLILVPRSRNQDKKKMLLNLNKLIKYPIRFDIESGVVMLG